MYQVIGVKQSEGSFTNDRNEEIAFDNIVLFIITDTDDSVTGCSSFEVKIKRPEFFNKTGVSDKECDTFVDKDVSIEYGVKNGKPYISRVRLSK